MLKVRGEGLVKVILTCGGSWVLVNFSHILQARIVVEGLRTGKRLHTCFPLEEQINSVPKSILLLEADREADR